jgi:2-phosphosulfolactate phosphatase
MRIERCTLNEAAPPRGVIVVIDVLRSFSTAAYALAAGARCVVPASDLAAARALRDRYAPALISGAAPGGRQLEGADLPNSPAAMSQGVLAGRGLVLITAGGIHALLESAHVERVFAAGLNVALATAEAVRALRPSLVTLMTTGAWSDRDGDEDIACADLIEDYLYGRPTDPAHHAQRVRCSDFGRQFGLAPHLPIEDLERAAQANCFSFAMPLQHNADGSVVLEAAAAA